MKRKSQGRILRTKLKAPKHYKTKCEPTHIHFMTDGSRTLSLFKHFLIFWREIVTLSFLFLLIIISANILNINLKIRLYNRRTDEH